MHYILAETHCISEKIHSISEINHCISGIKHCIPGIKHCIPGIKHCIPGITDSCSLQMPCLLGHLNDPSPYLAVILSFINLVKGFLIMKIYTKYQENIPQD